MTSTSAERQKHSQYLAPVLVISSLGILWYFLGKLLPVLVFTGAAPPGASAPVVVKNQSLRCAILSLFFVN